MEQLKKVIMDKTATTVWSYIVSIATAIGGYLSLNTIALLIGIFFTILLGLIQMRRYRRAIKMDAEYHAARLAALKDGYIPNIRPEEL